MDAIPPHTGTGLSQPLENSDLKNQLTKNQNCERVAHLVLQRLPKLGPVGFEKLRKQFKTLHDALNASEANLKNCLPDVALQTLKEIQGAGETHPLYQRANDDLAYCDAHNISLLLYGDQHYPALLQEIHRAPPVLFVKGCVENLHVPQLGIVGTRSPSVTGKENGFTFAKQLAQHGFAITSGLATGIDAAAHAGALAVGGRTIAVVGTGIDRLYPKRHKPLAADIVASGGTIVSEFPIGTAPAPANFPQRNRLISGLSVGVLVIEAAQKSGSLITAKYALQQNREVFAVPGSIHNPQSRGCHQLIKQGAVLVEQVDDLVEPLKGLLAFKWSEIPIMEKPSDHIKMSQQEALVFTCIGYEPTIMETLQARTQMDAGTLLSALVSLEIKGVIQQLSGAYQRKAEPQIEIV